MTDSLTISVGVLQILELISAAQSYKSTAISQTYGRPLGWLITTLPGNTATEYERIERVVLRGSDAEALRSETPLSQNVI